jgi:GT2 family glycosyltransferase
MKLSICIVNYDSGNLLAECLDSIDCYPFSGDFEIIVVDNCSEDGSQASAIGRANVRLIRNSENVGFAIGNNQALQISKGEYVLMLNPDTVITPKALDALVHCGESNPQAGLVSAKLTNPDGSVQVGFNVRRLPTVVSTCAQLMLVDEILPRNVISSRACCLDFDYTRVQAVEQPAASALLYRRTVLMQVGGFDPRLTNWYNDVDLCKRVLEAGWQILFCPASLIIHYHGMASASRSVESTTKEVYRSQRLYCLKHFGRIGYGVVSGCIVAGMMLRVLILYIFPMLEGRVDTRSRRDRPGAMRHAFFSVLVDTVKTWRSLPISFSGMS